MNYVSIEGTHHVTIKFKREMIIFAILTVALLCLTLGYWGILEIRQQRRERREDAAHRLYAKTWV